MSSTNKTSLGLNMWEASDKPVRQDFVNDNVIIDEKFTKLNSDLTKVTYSASNIYSQTLSGVTFTGIERIGKLVIATLSVTGGVFAAETNHMVGTLTKLKPAFQRRFALAGDGNSSTGNVSVSTNGQVTIRVESNTAYLSATLVYFTDDI
ncbi:hypothetical protein [Lacrimispora sp.]|uniref:hypothetical protein n=1 Tax=Lacrimispora sp. TaxID=2719234 RepID=UPI0028557113|nr:hypothetical protein [Lacrimispora sp.]MDR7811497.1 hypothetical protein [Lacrimispora sp.]